MFRMKGAYVAQEKDTRVIVGGRWKCDDCGRFIQHVLGRPPVD